MKSLKNYIIIENLDTENLDWKLDMWFSNNETQRQLLKDFLKTYQMSDTNNTDKINDFLTYSDFKYKEFLDFLCDNIYIDTTNFDYKYIFTILTKTLLGNKALII